MRDAIISWGFKKHLAESQAFRSDCTEIERFFQRSMLINR